MNKHFKKRNLVMIMALCVIITLPSISATPRTGGRVNNLHKGMRSI